MASKSSALGGCGVVVFVLVILALFIIPSGAFVSETVAVKALEDHGFSNVKVVDTAYYFISCRGGSGNDSVRFTCEATNPAGKPVTIYVFSGWLFKGATVRSTN